jgi:hypothetical protein
MNVHVDKLKFLFLFDIKIAPPLLFELVLAKLHLNILIFLFSFYK